MADLPLTSPVLNGLRVVEFSSFVAGPMGGMTLAQLGADVIRVDPIKGGPDAGRWPLSNRSGRSLFWDGLNKGKRSVAIDVRQAEGQELLIALATAPGPSSGILLENQASRPWLSHEALKKSREDCIQIHIEGSADGRAAVDYTVNPEVGLPWLTGPTNEAGPVNHVLPAWDLLAGMSAVTALLAALRHRDQTDQGQYIAIALKDIALAAIAGMGWFTEAEERGKDRERAGNYLYGSYGVDFETSDGVHVMVVALTGRQWTSLVEATGTAEVFKALEVAFGINLQDEGERYKHRESLSAVLRPWFAARAFTDVEAQLEAHRVLWSRYRQPSEVVADFRDAPDASILADVDQPGTGPVISARSPMRWGAEYGQAAPAPALGQDTESVLADVLGLSTAELGKLHDKGLVRSTRG
jgi:2-methylfumaryl-CoA isomerase